MFETILKVAVIVLVWLRMNDDRMANAGAGEKLHIGFQRLRRWFVRRARVVRKAGLIGGEQMNVGVHKQASRPRRGQRRRSQ